MKTLKELKENISIEDFNDLVLACLSGDEDYVEESLYNGEEITSSPDSYMERLCIGGFTNENFPWKELREYMAKVSHELQIKYIGG